MEKLHKTRPKNQTSSCWLSSQCINSHIRGFRVVTSGHHLTFLLQLHDHWHPFVVEQSTVTSNISYKEVCEGLVWPRVHSPLRQQNTQGSECQSLDMGKVVFIKFIIRTDIPSQRLSCFVMNTNFTLFTLHISTECCQYFSIVYFILTQ